jgi:hypothetical protein
MIKFWYLMTFDNDFFDFVIRIQFYILIIEIIISLYIYREVFNI